MNARTKLIFIVAIACLTLALPAVAQDAPERVAQMQSAGSVVSFQPLVPHGHIVLTLGGPEGVDERHVFKNGDIPQINLGAFPDGSYTYELRFVPALSEEAREHLAAAREAGLDGAKVLREKGLLADATMQSGAFTLAGGSVADRDLPESILKDQVILDDLIVDGSACIGMDCVNGEAFGFDTLRLKENNLRIKFDDTSNSASFPSNDWQITANDSGNGGANKFSIDDITGGRTPFTIEAGAPTNSLFVEDSGEVGFGTGTPVVELHVVDGDSPTLRLEQDGSSGFTPQTWDVAGNEANFFIRDVTNGSRLSFRIRPGAPESSIDIAANGDVGMGTSSPSEDLHVRDTDGTTQVLIEEANATTAARSLLKLSNSGNTRVELEDTSVSQSWFFSNNNGFLNFSLVGTGGPEVSVDNLGNMTITGGLVTGTAGNCTAGVPCDGTFIDYEVESIEDHAEYMWKNHHLYGVGPTRAGEPLDVTQKLTGMLHALEKAHIYIEQLHERLEALESQQQGE